MTVNNVLKISINVSIIGYSLNYFIVDATHLPGLHYFTDIPFLIIFLSNKKSNLINIKQPSPI